MGFANKIHRKVLVEPSADVAGTEITWSAKIVAKLDFLN